MLFYFTTNSEQCREINVKLTQRQKSVLTRPISLRDTVVCKNVKQSHNTHMEAWGERYSSYLLKTSALDGSKWSESRPGSDLPPRKEHRYPLDMRLGGPQSRSGYIG
jgi:hypothetical protein